MTCFLHIMKCRILFLVIVAFITTSPSFAQSGKAVYFDGTNAYMSVADMPDLDINGQNFSITCWIKTADFNKRIISKRQAPYGNAQPGYEFINSSSPNGYFGVNLRATDQTNVGPPFGTTGVTDYQWHNLAMVVNVADNTCRIYVDGGLQQTSTNSVISSGSFANAVNLIIGANNGLTSFLRGQMDDIRVWSKALSAAEVTSDMTTVITGPTTNLVAAWDFENVTVNTVPDVAGNSHTGTLNGNFSLVNVCNNVLSLDGTTGTFMNVVDHNDIDINSGESYTITCMIKTNTTVANPRILAKRNGTGGTAVGYEFISSGTGQFGLNLRSTPVNAGPAFSTATINNNQWRHLAMVVDQTAGNSKIYIDGVLDKTSATWATPQDFANAMDLIIGADATASHGNLWTGQIDDIRFWNKAMTATEVNTDRSTVVNGPLTNLMAAYDFENASGANVPDVSGLSHPGTLNGAATVLTICNTMQYAAATLVQTELATAKGKTNQRIIAVNVQTTGTGGSLNLTSLNFTMTGTTAISDVSSIKVYYTGSGNRFTTNTLFATVTPGAGTLSANGAQTLGSGNNYFWIAYDIAATAVEGNLADATCEGFTISGTPYTLISPANTIAGSRTILLESEILFSPGDAGSVSYRIPAIVTAADGTLVTVTDKRNNNTGDLANDIDLVVRRSADKGRTWTAPVTIVGTGTTTGSGDAALVLNRMNGEIICLYAYDQGFFSSTPSSPIRIRVIKSADNGITWNTPVDITNQIYGSGNTDPIRQNWYGVFVSSGRALQLRSGRIAAAIVVRQTSGGGIDNFMMYSDDGGTTWSVTTNAAELGGDESKLVELNDGKLLMSIRNSGTRRFNKSTTSVTTWNSANAYNQVDITDPNCNGEILRYTSTIDGDAQNRLLHSIPFAGNRSNVSVLLSKDEGVSWPTRKTIYPGASAYSTMTILPDKTIGMYYENGEYGDVYHMHFVRFSNFFLTGGLESPLPLSLLSFTGKTNLPGKTVTLNWSTTNERNVSHFEIEYSRDGRNFFKVGEVSAKNGDMNNSYSFLYRSANTEGSVFYRLKIIDIDNRFTYSNTIKLHFNGSMGLTVYPNPMEKEVSVNVSGNGQSNLYIINAAGFVIKRMRVTSQAFTINVESLGAGLYLFKLVGNDGYEEMVKVVKH